MTLKAKSIIFDLDGTLIDSSQSILAGFEHVLNTNSLKPLITPTSIIIGPPLIETLRRLTGVDDKKKILKMAEQFKEYYDFEACLLSQPYNDVNCGLKKLIKDNFDLYISTNKRNIPTRKIIKHLGWDNLFVSVYTLDQDGSYFKSKSEMIKRQLKDFSLSADQAIYIGDRAEDMKAAKNNRLNFIGVSWGYGKFTEDVKVIESFNELDKLVFQ